MSLQSICEEAVGVSRHAGVAAHKCVYSAADSGKHAESVIEGGVGL